jgi:hypothetical protein
MFTLRTHVIICATLFATLIGIAILGNVLQRAGVSPPTGAFRYIAAGTFFLVFFAFGLSAIPVIVKLVLGAQEKVGNENTELIGAAIRHQNRIIWIMWGLIIAGSLIAVPAAIIGGAFGDGPKRAVNRMFEGSELGVLAARPDMTLDQLVAQSSMKFDLRYARSSISAGGVFDYVIPGTTIRFEHARYYYMTTYSNDATRIRTVNVGTSRESMPVAGIDSADAELRKKLTDDGWLTGHEVYRTPQDQALHGGLTEGAEGGEWMKDGMVLSISRNRMDEQKRDEPAGSGEWIQYVDLWPAKDYPGFDRLVFQAPKR